MKANNIIRILLLCVAACSTDTVRLAMTGTQVTPGGAVEMAIILGKDESVKRLNASLKMIKDAL